MVFFITFDLNNHAIRNTDRHLTKVVQAMMNAVQILFKDDNLGHRIELVIKRLEVLNETPDSLILDQNVEIMLKNFCHWQMEQNSDQDGDQLHWDHAILLTGQDLYSVGSNDRKSSKIVGLSPVSGKKLAHQLMIAIRNQNRILQ